MSSLHDLVADKLERADRATRAALLRIPLANIDRWLAHGHTAPPPACAVAANPPARPAVAGRPPLGENGAVIAERNLTLLLSELAA